MHISAHANYFRTKYFFKIDVTFLTWHTKFSLQHFHIYFVCLFSHLPSPIPLPLSPGSFSSCNRTFCFHVMCVLLPLHILLSECYLLPYPHINIKVYNLHERQYNAPYLSLCVWPILLNLITFRSISVPTDAISYFFMVEQNPIVHI